ncbi:hypothetical protein DQ353_06525 [Arthrobacter sp. AQ5-05]|nr:hypothetical protein DQ353_06525 [Arthrobacter sp. AQ5-05]
MSPAASLAANPVVLLHDGPINNLDTAGLNWLEQRLATRRGAVVFCTHDRLPGADRRGNR